MHRADRRNSGRNESATLSSRLAAPPVSQANPHVTVRIQSAHGEGFAAKQRMGSWTASLGVCGGRPTGGAAVPLSASHVLDPHSLFAGRRSTHERLRLSSRQSVVGGLCCRLARLESISRRARPSSSPSSTTAPTSITRTCGTSSGPMKPSSRQAGRRRRRQRVRRRHPRLELRRQHAGCLAAARMPWPGKPRHADGEPDRRPEKQRRWESPPPARTAARLMILKVVGCGAHRSDPLDPKRLARALEYATKMGARILSFSNHWYATTPSSTRRSPR